MKVAGRWPYIMKRLKRRDMWMCSLLVPKIRASAAIRSGPNALQLLRWQQASSVSCKVIIHTCWLLSGIESDNCMYKLSLESASLTELHKSLKCGHQRLAMASSPVQPSTQSTDFHGGVWNSLPAHLRSPLISRGQFRAGLKTHLFKQAYSLWEHFVLRV